jgi:hypothetical protein
LAWGRLPHRLLYMINRSLEQIRSLHRRAIILDFDQSRIDGFLVENHFKLEKERLWKASKRGVVAVVRAVLERGNVEVDAGDDEMRSLSEQRLHKHTYTLLFIG